jgi:stage IV sporulation protein B
LLCHFKAGHFTPVLSLPIMSTLVIEGIFRRITPASCGNLKFWQTPRWSVICLQGRMIRLILAMVVLVTGIAAAVAITLCVTGFPEDLRFSPKQEYVYRVPFPLSIVIKEDQAGVIKPPNTGANDKFGGVCTALVIGPEHTGRAEIELRLFGFIPVRRVVVNVTESVEVIPSGHAIGVLLATEGVVIVGHVPLRGMDGKQYHPAKNAGLQAGDVLIAINDQKVSKVDDVERIINGLAASGSLILKIKRNGQVLHKEIEPVVSAPITGLKPRAMLGIYVQDPTAGVGTLTFFDPKSGVFAALGHMVSQPAPEVRLESGQSRIVEANISGVEAGSKGEPGEKIGTFRPGSAVVGTIYKNCRYGIYGQLQQEPPVSEYAKPIRIAPASEVETGPAEILTVLSGNKVGRYEVFIERVSPQQRPGDKGLVIAITDPELLAKTGGIVQGMSGSPIIQNGRLVGAITHVFVNDPKRGYGVLAEWMWQEAISTDLPKKAPEGISGAFLVLRVRRGMQATLIAC